MELILWGRVGNIPAGKESPETTCQEALSMLRKVRSGLTPGVLLVVLVALVLPMGPRNLVRAEDPDEVQQEVAAMKKILAHTNQLLREYQDLAERRTKQVEKLQQENAALTKILDVRDAQAMKLLQDKDVYFKEMHRAQMERDIAVSRMEQMQKQLKEASLSTELEAAEPRLDELVKGCWKPTPAQVDQVGEPKVTTKTSAAAAFHTGTIAKIEYLKNQCILEISMGYEDGLHLGQTLVVVRSAPTLKVLGMVSIQMINAHTSVGRQIQPPDGQAEAFQVGDMVIGPP
jgi:hypothetical protein